MVCSDDGALVMESSRDHSPPVLVPRVMYVFELVWVDPSAQGVFVLVVTWLLEFDVFWVDDPFLASSAYYGFCGWRTKSSLARTVTFSLSRSP